jgi:GLPGLI family protein
MKRIFQVLAVVTFLLNTQHVTAQEKIKEGKITFEITINNAEEMNDQMLAMMPKEMIMYFKGEKSRGELEMMGGKVITLTDGKSGESTTFMDLMGKKQAIKTSKEESEKEKAGMGDYEVKHSDETKEIAGYKCKKATVVYKDSEKSAPIEVWYTTELEASNSAKYAWKGIDGFMMEFLVDQKGMSMKFTCTEVKKQEVKDDMFDVPEGYTVITQEEMMKQYGR